MWLTRGPTEFGHVSSACERGRLASGSSLPVRGEMPRSGVADRPGSPVEAHQRLGSIGRMVKWDEWDLSPQDVSFPFLPFYSVLNFF
jgi:hypothetical protein